MRRLFLYCLICLPIWTHAEPSDMAPVPEPPEMSPDNRTSAEVAQKATAKKAAVKKTEDKDETPPSATPEPPDLPMPVQSGETLEPDITITRRGQDTIQEFRAGGKLYMVKVIPDIGPAYYFIDADEDGMMDARKNYLDRGSKVNMWKLFEW